MPQQTDFGGGVIVRRVSSAKADKIARSLEETASKSEEEKKARDKTYLDQKVACPVCKKKRPLRDLVVYETNYPRGGGGIPPIERLECKEPNCRVYFGPPERK